MIDVDDIEYHFHNIFCFRQAGKDFIQINGHTGEVTVFGSITCYGSDISQLPFRISSVSGDMIMRNCPNLTTFKGFPRQVKGSLRLNNTGISSLGGCPDQVLGPEFRVTNSRLTSLQGLPHFQRSMIISFVGNPLKSLEGIYEGLSSIVVSYDPDLPVLRLLLAQHSAVVSGDIDDFNSRIPGEEITRIINKNKGQGPAGILMCASELTEAGYEGNAEW